MNENFFPVSKKESDDYNQGFAWIYRYRENNQTKIIESTDINKLKEKVLNQNLKWNLHNISGIYLIENKINGHLYVGQAIDIKKRWIHHQNRLNNNDGKPNLHLQSAWNKYGAENFNFYVLERCDSNELNQREIYWIKKLNTCHNQNHYNMNEGGSTNLGYKHTIEAKRRMSKLKKGKQLSMEHRHKLSLSHKNMSDEIRRNISEGHKGLKHSINTKRKISNANKKFYRNNPDKIKKGKEHHRYGQKHTEEVKKIISEKNKGEKNGMFGIFGKEHHSYHNYPVIHKINSTNNGVFYNLYYESKIIMRSKKREILENLIEESENKNIDLKILVKKYKKNKLNLSSETNETGIFRVTKKKSNRYKQGFVYVYRYNENKKRKSIQRTDLDSLEKEVKKRELPWIRYEDIL
ncbi:GIY-YIG nuclease family protein [uncultured Methanobrevibacter sp.]|uniref:GIY-YIG nuclease family protein n=1 Tax=uncultured Methanobrevibacter sp. TaxID=253161 RepID=UPI0025CC2097|nr:GIY-YIG nuclease family protein [uncultured Methanobrevibacter sp.]